MSKGKFVTILLLTLATICVNMDIHSRISDQSQRIDVLSARCDSLSVAVHKSACLNVAVADYVLPELEGE